MSKRKEYFSNRSDMYHYVASNDYDGGYVRSANSHIYNGDVYSYATKVGMFDKTKEILLYTGNNYSQTTSHTVYELTRAFDHYERFMVYDFNLRDGWDRLKEAVKLHSKHPATRKQEKEYFIETVNSLKGLVKFFGKGNNYLSSATYKKAEDIVTKYKEQMEAKRKRQEAKMEAKRKRQEAILEARRQREEQERKECIDRTVAVIKEYNPDYEAEPKTFRECMNKECIRIPVAWMSEHHPELFEEEGSIYLDRSKVCFGRQYDYDKREYEPDFTYRAECSNIKLMRQISRWGGSYTSSPDILVYYADEKMLRTSQHCHVDDSEGHCKKLLGLLLKAIDEGKDTSFVDGRHCGPYEIRGYDTTGRFLRVGCHCFLLENLREVYNDMKGV